ncbi:hypothetical protein [Clostridium beijerinckii]|uniref:Uncharacterized protein n=1 Tax=Clostridium beijerinckii TaxID=1520 RepID=A0AAE5LN29_CLOBE|nr:hypothetical protein [Clostridium beijerinckii]NSB12096.1 hypothetical protein [Clostridium beijerinckii]OOM27430.1 hypothetical protein CLOBE_29880 [Clostridium beijerinckii]
MSFNLYSQIIKVLNENGQDANLEEIGKINNIINNLISRNINREWIKNNLEVLI